MIREQQQTDPVMTIGQELSSLKTSNIQKEALIQTMGEQLAMVKLELIQLKGGGN
ncbi:MULTISPECIES: XkdW family protein [unclassified Brevibacillus]|uniref:XkdW family protein n=1 Tax=unclassified Brevibacillus TaxID=2684853 RepID=UPI00356834E5